MKVKEGKGRGYRERELMKWRLEGKIAEAKGQGREEREPLTWARGGREERRRRGGSRESEQPGEGAARGAGVPTPWNSLSTWS